MMLCEELEEGSLDEDSEADETESEGMSGLAVAEALDGISVCCCGEEDCCSPQENKRNRDNMPPTKRFFMAIIIA